MQQYKNFYGIELPDSLVKKARNRKQYLENKFKKKAVPVTSLAVQQQSANDAILDFSRIEAGQSDSLELGKNPLIISTLRMGYGHYRIALAIASAAKHLKQKAYFLDYLTFKDSYADHSINWLEHLYNTGSKISQKIPLFNRLVWEPITGKAAMKVSYALKDIAMCELFADIPALLDPNVPYIATHPWAAHPAVVAGIQKIVTTIPDNYPLAFYVSPGCLHAVQSPSSYLGYRTLRKMSYSKNVDLNPIPTDQIFLAGHYVDHEIVDNIEHDGALRERRVRDKRVRRLLMTIGGAGAQLRKFANIISDLLPSIEQQEVTVFVNLGDHQGQWKALKPILDHRQLKYTLHTDWNETQNFAKTVLKESARGLHIFLHDDIFPAVYSTNLLMRASDVMITKPSELAFYPVPKLFIERVGRHEAWGAIRGSELGDATLETRSKRGVRSLINMLVFEDDLLAQYCKHIRHNKKSGIYDGAYNVVRKACGIEKKIR
jgi:hypothetical protein